MKVPTLPSDVKNLIQLPYNDPLIKLLLKIKQKGDKNCSPIAMLTLSRHKIWIFSRNEIGRYSSSELFPVQRGKY